jgi:hypothetical protein
VRCLISARPRYKRSGKCAVSPKKDSTAHTSPLDSVWLLPPSPWPDCPLTRMLDPELSPYGPSDLARGQTRATPPRSRRPGTSAAGPLPWPARPGSVTTELASLAEVLLLQRRDDCILGINSILIKVLTTVFGPAVDIPDWFAGGLCSSLVKAYFGCIN